MENKAGYPSIDKPWLQFYDDGAYEKALNSPKDKSIWEFYKPIIESYDDKLPLITYFNKSFNNKEYLDLVISWAKTFRAMGIEPDEMVPIYGTWSPDISAMFLALNMIGAHPYFEKLDITKDALLKETGSAKVGVVHEALWSDVSNVFDDPKFKKVIISKINDHVKGPLKYVMDLKSEKIPYGDKYIKAREALGVGEYYTGSLDTAFRPGRIASITSSSGTSSSVVNGIMDTNESILSNIIGTSLAKPKYEVGKKILLTLPPTASTALNCLFLLPIYHKMSIIMDPRISEDDWYKLVTDNKVSVALTTGSLWERYFRDLEKELQKGKKVDLSHADFYIMGGSGTTPEKLAHMNELLKKCNATSKIISGYGSSEFFGVASVNKASVDNPNKDMKDVIDVGLPIAGAIIGIFDEDGNELPYNTRGEIYMKGPAVMEGYYGKEELTKKTIVNGWFRTGDIGEMDENGYLYIYGRKKDSVVINDNKIYLFDIANVLRKTFDLDDCMAEKKTLATGDDVIVIYFVQKEDKKKDNKEICMQMDSFMKENGITVDGFLESDLAFKISPTTLKPQTRVLNGFIIYDENGNKSNISYELTDEDDILLKTVQKEDYQRKRKNIKL